MDFLARNLWERKYLDLWTVVHLTTGMCFGFSFFFYGSPFLESFAVFSAFMIFWEVMEHYHQAKEPFTNQFIDVLSGAIGFLLTVKFIPILAPTFPAQMAYFTLVYIVAWTFAYYGFQSFATHFDRDMVKYKKSFSAAAIVYVAIVASLLVS